MNEEFSKLFDKLIKKAAQFNSTTENRQTVEEYAPPNKNPEAPIYTPLHFGPRPLSIAEYKARQKKYSRIVKEVIPSKQKTRAGRQVRLRRQIAELHRIIPIARGKEKKNLIQKLKALKIKLYSKKNGWTTNEVRSQTGDQQ